MIGITSALLVLPLFSVLGTVILWWMLPFLAAAVAMLWFALKRSYADRRVYETLERKGDDVTLTHFPARGQPVSWSCNIFWVRVDIHKTGGPVDHYLTLTGSGRTVEIGKFLSEDERKALFGELSNYLSEQR